MPITQSQKNYRTTVVEVRHINPSIMEGEYIHHSLLGNGSAIPIVRYAPTFLVQPSITGSFKIPSVLTCNPGVTDGSPSPNVFYQWKVDGVDIVGETSNTLTTISEYDATDISCEVVVVNPLGTDTALSNSINVQLIEPIRVEEQAFGIISGMNQKNSINIMSNNVSILSGLTIDLQAQAATHSVGVVTGSSSTGRLDVQSMSICVITFT